MSYDAKLGDRPNLVDSGKDSSPKSHGVESMKQFIALLSLALLPFASAYAEVAILGLTLGETTKSEALKNWPASASPQNNGINKFSNGPMLKSSGGGAAIESIEAITAIFDSNNVLAAVILTMPKHRFDSVMGFMSQKYALREKRIPFVGNKHARFGAPGATLEISAPHMSFSMDVMYQTDAFVSAFKRISNEEKKRKQQSEGAQF